MFNKFSSITSHSDTGETSRFKIKHTEPVTNVEDTANIGDNSQNTSNSQNDDNQTLFTATAQKVGKHKKRKNKKTRKPSPETSSSDSGNSSSSEESVVEGNSTKSPRFQIIFKAESHKWELPGEMADYVNHQFEYFIPEKDENENVRQERERTGQCQGRQKIRQFCKVYYGVERTSFKPGCNEEKTPTENFRCFRAPF